MKYITNPNVFEVQIRLVKSAQNKETKKTKDIYADGLREFAWNGSFEGGGSRFLTS